MILRAPRDTADLNSLSLLLELYDVPQFYEADPITVRAELRKRVYSGALRCLLAFDDLTPAGFLLFNYDHLQRLCNFADMFVRPGYRGGTVALDLARQVVEISKQAGMTGCIFSTDEYNPKVWEKIIGGKIKENVKYTGRYE